MKPLRFAVIATGFWRHYQIPAWKKPEGVEPIAVCNSTRARANEVAEKFGVRKVYDTAEKLLDSEPLDFGDITTDVDTHTHFMLVAAQRDVHVICP